MILAAGSLLGVCLGVVTGGRLRFLETVPTVHLWLLFAGLLVQSVFISLDMTDVLPAGTAVLVCWAAPAILAIVVLVVNRKIPGMLVVALGLALNVAVVLPNHGMPVLAANAIHVGIAAEDASARIGDSWLHVKEDPDTALSVLGDVIPIPGPRGIRGLISIGDAILAVGASYVVFVAMHSPPADPQE